jgi:hypothetical protein
MSISSSELERINALDGPQLIVALRDVYRRTVAEVDRAVIAAAAQHIAKGAAANTAAPAPASRDDVSGDPAAFAPGNRVLIGIREGILIDYEGGLWNVCVSKLGEFGVEHRIVAARPDQITHIKT